MKLGAVLSCIKLRKGRAVQQTCSWVWHCWFLHCRYVQSTAQVPAGLHQEPAGAKGQICLPSCPGCVQLPTGLALTSHQAERSGCSRPLGRRFCAGNGHTEIRATVHLLGGKMSVCHPDGKLKGGKKFRLSQPSCNVFIKKRSVGNTQSLFK